jgi:hypothetical protein
MKEQIASLGASPIKEACAQLGNKGYAIDSTVECTTYMRQLLRLHPKPQGVSAKLRVLVHPHDFGSYRDVSVVYDTASEADLSYARQLCNGRPEIWDAVARYELAWFHAYFAYQGALQANRMKLDEIPTQYRRSQPTLEVEPNATFSEILRAHPL